MKFVFVAIIAAAVIAIRVGIYRYRRRRRQGPSSASVVEAAGAGTPVAPGAPASREPRDTTRVSGRLAAEGSFATAWLVAMREIRERVRGRIFRVGTVVVLLAVGAAIVVPTLINGSGPSTQTIGYVGTLDATTARVVHELGAKNGDTVKLVPKASLEAAKAALHDGTVDFVIVDSSAIVLEQPPTSKSSPADASLVLDVADYLGVRKAYEAAGLTPAQAAQIDGSKPVPVHVLQPSSKGPARASSVIGIIVLFIMLTQYLTWILIGVMQEKASRVVEVLLATLRPLQLLGGKVLGIGLVALGQAALIVGFALALGAAVGSDLLRGTAPLVLVCQLLWLVLGYAFYCWVYAAAGSMAERQDQVQTLALPLSIPILIGYVFSITVASSGNADVLYEILAYLPPTAPFAMPVLVGLNEVAWWQFTLSVLISIAGTVAMAIFAARVYQRAVLRSGRRVRLSELFAHT